MIDKKRVVKLTEDNYTELAEQAIVKLEGKTSKNGKKIQMVTTSKIRNLLAMVSDIYNEIMNTQEEKLSQDVVGRIKYMKIRFVYEAGREPRVKDLVDEASLLEHLDEIGSSKKQYILFSRYMEALVAYHRYYGGKDK